MDWITLTQEIISLSKKINYTPDIIVGITKGGIIPARLLSSYLKVENMYCISVSKIGEKRKVVTEILDNLKNKNILLIEDMLETGRSLIVAKKYLESKGARVRTVCLYTMPVSEIKPDFYLREVDKIKNFPWE